MVLLGVLLAALLGVGVFSLVDKDAETSMLEKRELAKMPAFSWSSLWDGSYIEGLEKHYADTFPGREKLLGLNRTMNKFYYFSPGEENILVLDYAGGAEQGGESLHDVEAALDGIVPAVAPTLPPSTPTEGEQKPSGEQTPAGKPAEPEYPELDTPGEGEAQTAGNVVIVGDRAMDVPTALNDIIDSYAGAVNRLNQELGPDVRTISLVTPNAAAFYAPESMRTGVHDQKALIDYCYSQMDEDIVTVDAYSALRSHTDEYIYFRTDHHWTALGAYYAYQNFCKALGFDAVKLDEFESGTYEGFVGSMYTFTQNYPQSQVLLDNPDTLTYYLPKVETHAKIYQDATLSDGMAVSVVYTKVREDVSNKYLCFIGGDSPVCVIETAVDGPVCLMLKESYGNAFAPWLTNHYSKIVIVDPREFNQAGKPSLDLREFAKEQGVNDLLVLNYPFMTCNQYYAEWLNRLVT